MVLLTLNRFDTLFLCFHCWLWKCKYPENVNAVILAKPANMYSFKLNNAIIRKKVWNLVKVKNKSTRTTSKTCIYFQLWTYFASFSNVSITGFEQAIQLPTLFNESVKRYKISCINTMFLFCWIVIVAFQMYLLGFLFPLEYLLFIMVIASDSSWNAPFLKAIRPVLFHSKNS